MIVYISPLGALGEDPESDSDKGGILTVTYKLPVHTESLGVAAVNDIQVIQHFQVVVGMAEVSAKSRRSRCGQPFRLAP